MWQPGLQSKVVRHLQVSRVSLLVCIELPSVVSCEASAYMHMRSVYVFVLVYVSTAETAVTRSVMCEGRNV